MWRSHQDTEDLKLEYIFNKEKNFISIFIYKRIYFIILNLDQNLRFLFCLNRIFESNSIYEKKNNNFILLLIKKSIKLSDLYRKRKKWLLYFFKFYFIEIVLSLNLKKDKKIILIILKNTIKQMEL